MLTGVYAVNVLKKKWKYLREKYVREKKSYGSGGKNVWVHMASMQFLSDLVTNDKK